MAETDTKPTFKYRVTEDTYRDMRRMGPGEEWITQEAIHDSRALLPADEATEEAYLRAYAAVPTRLPVHDASGRVIDYKPGPDRRGQHVTAILERRKIPKDEHEVYVRVYGKLARKRRESEEAAKESKANAVIAAQEKLEAEVLRKIEQPKAKA